MPPPVPVPRLVGVAALTARSSPIGWLPRAPPLPASLACRCRRSSSSSRFSNAETGEGASRARRRWWSDSDAQRDLDYDVEDDYDDNGGGVFDEPWFSKVFRTYGYVLPVVLASMFLATGPKAFLMAMAIPLGQSAISFVLDTIWGTRGRRGNRRTAYEEYEYDDNDDFDAQENWGENKTYSYYNRTKESSYQRSAESDDVDHTSTSSNRPNQSGGTSTESRFGGWDELDLDSNYYNSERSPRPPPGTRTADNAGLRRGGGSRQRMSMRRMTNRYKQAPLFMRLMVAVFPFIGSWLRIL